MLKRHKGFIVLLFVGILLRIFLVMWAVQFREHPDILRWKDWGQIAFLHGFADTYTPTHLSFGTYPNNMPPMTLYIVSSMYWVWLQMGKVLNLFGIAPGSNPWVNTVLLTIFLRIPSLLCDIGIAAMIYWTVFRSIKRERNAYIAASVFLFNPVVLYNSAIWGQMDSINNFFFLIGISYLTLGKYVASSFSYALSLLTKFSLLTMAPVFVALAWLQSKKNLRIIFIYGVVLVVATLFAVVPISKTPWQWYATYLQGNVTGEMTNVTAFAFNAWWVIFRPTLLLGIITDAFDVTNISLIHSPLVETLYGVVSLKAISIFISLTSMALVYWSWWKQNASKKRTIQSVYILITSIAIISYLFSPQMHERYLYPVWAPLAILIGLGFPVSSEFVGLSLLNLINIFIVWHPMPLPFWVYDLMRNANFQWGTAIMTVIVGVRTVVKVLSKNKAY